MKLKRILLSFVLVFVCAVSVFTLSGCDDVSLKTLTESFDKLDQTYAQYNDVFVVSDFEGIEDTFVVTYGDDVDAWVAQEKDSFVELKNLYNMTLAISSDYIKNNKMSALDWPEGKLNKAQQKAFNDLNKSVVEYTKNIEDFVTARSAMIDYFSRFGKTASDQENETHLREFKRHYGELVEKNVTLSSNLAKVIEETDVFEILQKTELFENDSIVIKEYVRAKLLPVFSKFMIEEIANKLNWSATTQTTTKTRIDNVINDLLSQFDFLKENFVLRPDSTIDKLTTTELKETLDLIDDFMVECEAYFKAVKRLDVQTLSGLTYDNDMGKYLQKNSMAEIYLNKIEQFTEISLPQFTESMVSVLY